jgi:hypothetical protein
MVAKKDAGRELLARHDFRPWQTRIQLLNENIESCLFDLVGRSSQLDRLIASALASAKGLGFGSSSACKISSRVGDTATTFSFIDRRSSSEPHGTRRA